MDSLENFMIHQIKNEKLKTNFNFSYNNIIINSIPNIIINSIPNIKKKDYSIILPLSPSSPSYSQYPSSPLFPQAPPVSPVSPDSSNNMKDDIEKIFEEDIQEDIEEDLSYLPYIIYTKSS
jgi:hypothetical protein